MNGNNEGQKRHGFSVYWNVTNEATERSEPKRRDFTEKSAATEFMATLPEASRPRLFNPPEQTTQEFEQIGRENADVLNRQRMVKLMLKHNITIPAKQFDKWRPTEEKTGQIIGVADGLTCIMTDGLLGYFLREDRDPLYGHVQHFKWDEPTISFVPYIDENGEQKFFKQVKDQGAPSAYYKRPSKPAPIRERKPKEKKVHVPMTANAALEIIKQMTLGKPQ